MPLKRQPLYGLAHLIQLSLRDRLVRGSSADLFAPPRSGRIFKLFRKPASTRGQKLSQRIFSGEVAAYERACANSGLRGHIPQFFGTTAVAKVLGRVNQDVSYRYLLECCICIERLPGKDRKLFGVPDPHLGPVLSLLERFNAAGIAYVADASVFGWMNPSSMKFIDFAIVDPSFYQ